MLSRRSTLGGLGAFGLGLWPRPGPAQTDTGQKWYGWDPQVAAPTQADFYVAPHGSDSSAGSASAPFRTIQKGVNMLAQLPGGSLAIRGGLYREAVTLDRLQGHGDTPFHIHRYGREPVRITAAEPLVHWEPCPQDEARSIGAEPSGLYVARLSREALTHDAPLALNLHEKGQWLPIAVDRADPGDPETSRDENTFHRGRFHVDTEDRILAIEEARLRGLPATAMDQVQALIYHAPNIISADTLGGFDPESGTLTLSEQSRRVERRGAEVFPLYALQNAGWALHKGSWCVRTQGDIVSVYLRPINPASLHSDIEISTRGTCVDLGRARHVHLFGLELSRAAGEARLDGIALRRSSIGLEGGEGITLTHCRIGETLFAGARGEGAIHLVDVQDPAIHHCSIGPARNSFGLALHESEGASLRHLHITGVSNSPARFFGMRRGVLAFSLFENSAWDAHANAFNFYQGSDAILVWGVRLRDVGGYVTYQKASRIVFCFCEFPCDPSSWNRALVSQNYPAGAGHGGPDGSGAPRTGDTFRYWNLTLSPNPRHLEPADALFLGPSGSTHAHDIRNSILHGGGLGVAYARDAPRALESRSHNLYTGFSYWQSLRYGWQLHEGEARIPIGGQVANRRGADLRTRISNELMPLFPDFNGWEVDIDGQIIDWSNPPIGCRVGG